MKIAQNGKPLSSIVVPSAATETEAFAAGELQHYLAQMSDAELPIVVEGDSGNGCRLLIGSTKPGREAKDGLGQGDPESFVVRRQGSDLLLVGASDRSTLYAVYDFLEDDMGCRWLGPGPDWEEVPKRATLELPGVDRTESPAMQFRYLRMTRVGEPGSWQDHCLSWSAKQKINIGNGWPPDDLPAPISKRGGFQAWMAPHSLIPNTLPEGRYFGEHPEWFSMRDGERYGGYRTQLCTTQPEVVERIAAGVADIFDVRPEMAFMGMGQADGTNFCECEACTALDTGEIWDRGKPVISERWLSFVNAVARKLHQTHPGKQVYTLAYHQTFRPPDPQTIRPEPNVMIQVVNSRPNYVCFVHRFEDESCPRHVKFRRGLENWVDMTPAGVMVYEYVPHSTFCSMPYPVPRKFVADIKYLHGLGIVGYEGQSAPNQWGTYGIALYAIAKTTWDPSIDADDLVKDYCDHAFHEASEPMQRFVATVEHGLETADHVTDGVWTYMTPEVMAEAREHLDAAHAAAESEVVRKRLRCYEIGFHYGELASEAWRKARGALTEKDAPALALAIGLAEEACQYVADEEEKAPHHAAHPGKLKSVHLQGWKKMLDGMSR
ncbi:MAG: DUF4838 domain-containing protein [Candidatus Latescibacteria bacterium]|jgi:hypothetical protein|nr:DUF4838 domain-containing protein [Candidatus Latescibacterota bacterium]